MHISIDTTEPLSATDKAVLAVLSGGPSLIVSGSLEAKDVAAAPAKKAPAPAKAEKPEPTPEPVVEDVTEDEVEDEPAEVEETATATLEDAVALATKMVSNGEAKKVKEALSAVGAKKVSEIPADSVDKFIVALS